MTLITVLRVSKESHSGAASPQPSKSKTGRHPKAVRPSGKCFIGSLTVIFPISTARPSSVTGADVNIESSHGVIRVDVSPRPGWRVHVGRKARVDFRGVERCDGFGSRKGYGR